MSELNTRTAETTNEIGEKVTVTRTHTRPSHDGTVVLPIVAFGLIFYFMASTANSVSETAAKSGMPYDMSETMEPVITRMRLAEQGAQGFVAQYGSLGDHDITLVDLYNIGLIGSKYIPSKNDPNIVVKPDVLVFQKGQGRYVEHVVTYQEAIEDEDTRLDVCRFFDFKYKSYFKEAGCDIDGKLVTLWAKAY